VAGEARPGNAIRDYAVIGDCHTSALVGRNGSIDWLCFPRPDSPAVFCHLLDSQHGGNFSVRAAGTRAGGATDPAGAGAAARPGPGASVTRHYLDDTNVLVTNWTTPEGVLEVVDSMPVGPFDPARPAEVRASHSVLRRLRCLEGEVTAEVRITPRFEYGLVVPRLRMLSPWAAEFMGGASSLSVRATHPLERWEAHTLRRGDILAGDWRIGAGETAWVSAVWAPAHVPCEEPVEVDAVRWQGQLDDTIDFWRTWISGCRYQGDYTGAVRRSALVLKLLTYAPTGAVLAAATTSLPEELGGTRNWDYRFTWIRDATLTLTSLFILGLGGEAEAFKAWIERSGAGRPQDLQVMYGVAGERMLPEVELDHLQGHAGSRPVRIGNGAVKQLQLDCYGQLLEAAYLFAKAGHEITEDNWTFLSGLADLCCEMWLRPDQGIWEVRHEPRHYLHSKASCWLALHRAVQLAELLGTKPGECWETTRDALFDYMIDSAKAGYFPQAVGSDQADAATLLIPAFGLVPADHPLVQATVDAVRRQLSGSGGLLYRYLADDGISGGEGAFLLCSFWLVDVLAHAGRVAEAEALLEQLLGLANDVGLYAEEVDPNTGDHLGNTPQAFTHMALVSSCAYVSAARRGLLPNDGEPHDFAELALERLLSS
jgi:GH15 family glucan-1,4-alpha-glucosidase